MPFAPKNFSAPSASRSIASTHARKAPSPPQTWSRYVARLTGSTISRAFRKMSSADSISLPTHAPSGNTRGQSQRIFLFLGLDALEQPHLGHFPVAADGLFVHPEQSGYFCVVQPAEESQLDDVRFLRVLRSQSLQCFVDLKYLFVLDWGFESGFVQFGPFPSAAAFEPELAPRVLHQNPPHGLRGCPEEMAAVLPVGLLVCAQPQPRLMHERRRLECLARRFIRHLGGGEAAQLVVNQREQFIPAHGWIVPMFRLANKTA